MSTRDNRRTEGGHRCVVLGAVLVVAVSVLVSCGENGDTGRRASTGAQRSAEADAGRWRPWILSSPDAITVPAPPPADSDSARADLAEVSRATEARTAASRERIERWAPPLPTQPWTEMAMDFVSKSAKNPPLSSRNYALVHVAMYDAVVSAWHWKYRYNVAPPKRIDTVGPAGADPSYPSEHAAIAGAASRVLAHLYPEQPGERLDEMAEESGRSRVEAGTNTPRDVEAGLELGRAVAARVIEYAKGDGAGRPWNGTRPPGIGRGPEFWEPPPGAVSPPTDPLAGTWKTWVMTSGAQFRPGPPPAYGSPEFVAAGRELIEIKDNLTPEQERIAKFWEGAEGTELPAGIVLRLVSGDLARAATEGDGGRTWSIPRTARALAMVTVALADAGIAAWDAKFTYWNPRPENAIRDLGLDPDWEPFLPTPRFPAYPSGSAGYAGAAEAVMSYLFPGRAGEFRSRAEEQAISRLYAGIHWRYDAISMEAGRSIGGLVVERSRRDGADR